MILKGGIEEVVHVRLGFRSVEGQFLLGNMPTVKVFQGFVEDEAADTCIEAGFGYFYIFHIEKTLKKEMERTGQPGLELVGAVAVLVVVLCIEVFQVIFMLELAVVGTKGVGTLPICFYLDGVLQVL